MRVCQSSIVLTSDDRVPAKDDIFVTKAGEDDILHYGQHVKISCVPELNPSNVSLLLRDDSKMISINTVW